MSRVLLANFAVVNGISSMAVQVLDILKNHNR